MKAARRYYVKELCSRRGWGKGAQFHHPAMHAAILGFVKDNPGLTSSETAARVGKRTDLRRLPRVAPEEVT